MKNLLNVWNRLSRVPGGARLFSIAFARTAPYFATVRPRVTEVRPNQVEVVIRNRRRVHNHIGTVHVIAICNGLEMAMGALAEATIPQDKRWIPKGMEVSYPAKADTDITCFAQTSPQQWSSDVPDLPVRVWATRADGTVVVEGEIRLWVTPKPSRQPAGRE